MSKRWAEHLSNISPKATIGADCVIHAGVHIHDEVVIGDRCLIQAMAFIPNGVTIGDDVFVGPAVVFTNNRNLTEPWEMSRTIIKNGVKIGANATIIAGVTLGEGCVIGAGAVVTKDVPAGELWVGNPAKFLRIC